MYVLKGDVNSLARVTYESQEYLSLTNNGDSTLYLYRLYRNNNLPCLQMIYLILKEKNNLITISVAVTTQKLTEKTLYAMHCKVV